MAEKRRFLIAGGTGIYDHLAEDQQLPSVKDDIAQIVNWFTSCGYEQVLRHLSISPTAQELRQSIGDWFADEQRTNNDRVVFYYSGHGEVLENNGHYLCGRDARYSGATLLSHTAYSDEEVAKAFAASRVQHALIIFDTCFASAGIRSLSQKASAIIRRSNWDHALPHGIHLIAAARDWEIAKQGIFAQVFCEVVKNREFELGGKTQEYLRPAAVTEVVTKVFKTRHYCQSAEYGLATAISRETAELLPNPRFEKGHPSGLDLLEHWLPKASGGAIAIEGWYFTGRERALTELVAWLTARGTDGRARIVTGSAGSGKSALLAALVTLADREQRLRLEDGGMLRTFAAGAIPPVGIIDLAIHARGKTLQDIVGLVGDKIGSACSASDVIQALKLRTKVFVLVIDALDESVDPFKIASELLRQMASLATVKLLIATRPDRIAGKTGRRVQGLGSATAEIDLDSSDYLGPRDIEDYVTSRLLATAEPERKTPYRSRVELASAVAHEVAKQSRGIFLIARVVSDTLTGESEPRKLGALKFPNELGDAFDSLFETFDRPGDLGKQTVLNLLRPLAYAEGAGLPWESVWATLASALARSEYLNEDIGAMLRRAAGFVLESNEDGRSVYQLYHQALADHLRRDQDLVEVQLAMSRALISSVPQSANSKTEWQRADPYVLTHLAAHAAKAKSLNELLLDPTYIIAADRQRLMLALQAGGADQITDAPFAYQLAYHHLSNWDPGVRLSYLQFAARMNQNLPATWLAKSDIFQQWSVLWADWQRQSPHWSIVVETHSRNPDHYFSNRSGRLGQNAISALHVAHLQDVAVVISGNVDGTLQLWGLADGHPVTPGVVAHEEAVNSIATIELDSRLIILSAGEDGVLSIWDVSDGSLPKTLYKKEGWPLNVVATGVVEGRPKAVFGGAGDVIRMVDLITANVEEGIGSTDDEDIYVLAMREIGGTPTIVAGASRGELLVRSMHSDKSRSWTRDVGRNVVSVAIVTIGGVDRIVSVNGDGQILIFDLFGTEVASFSTGHNITRHNGHRKGYLVAACFETYKGRALLSAVDYEAVVRTVDLAMQRSVAESIIGLAGERMVLTPYIGNDLSLLSGGNDGVLRIWPVRFGVAAEGRDPNDRHCRCLTVGKMGGRLTVAAGSYNGHIYFVDASDGTPFGEDWRGHAGIIHGIAYIELRGQPCVVTHGSDGAQRRFIRFWNLDKTAAAPDIGPFADGFALEVLQLGANPLIAFDAANELVVLDVEHQTSVKLGNRHSDEILKLQFSWHKNRLVLATGDVGGRINVWDVADRKVLFPSIKERARIAALAFSEWQGRSHIFAGGSDGRISAWNLDDGNLIVGPHRIHNEGINTMLIGRSNGQTVGLSGAADCTIALWRPNGELIFRIDVGAWVFAITPIAEKSVVVGTAKGLLAINFTDVSFK